MNGNNGISHKTDNVQIYQKMNKVMKSFGAVEKDGTNDYHNYDYIKEEDVVNEARKQFAKHGIHCNSTVIDQESSGDYRRVLVEFILTDLDSGQQFISKYWGEGTDKGDKAFYKAYAGATKYFIMKNFLIGSGDDPEGDITTDQRAYGTDGQKNESSSMNNKKVARSETTKASDKKKELIIAVKKGIDGKKSEKLANGFLDMLGKNSVSQLDTGELQALKNKLN